jgi:hypothetical protein
MFDIRNLFAIKKAKKSAKNGTGGGRSNKNLAFITVMTEGKGAGGVDGEVVGDVVIVEIGGCGRRRCGGRRRSDRDEVRSGEVSKRVVEEIGDIGVARSEEGVGLVNVGKTSV